MIWRAHFYSEMDGSQGYGYAKTKREIQAIAREFVQVDPADRSAEIESASFPLNCSELVRLLRRWAGHAENG